MWYVTVPQDPFYDTTEMFDENMPVSSVDEVVAGPFTSVREAQKCAKELGLYAVTE
jgi:hypothetical protein